MSSEPDFADEQRALVLGLADRRLQHPQEWLRQRCESFLNGTRSRRAGQPWGWKEPNTHIVIDQFLELHLMLRYIHFVRHPIDMALSTNQNQLESWGPVLLNRDVVKEPRQSLAYWCGAHRRVNEVMQRWPERTLVVDFDDLCADPETQGMRVARFLGAAIPDRFGANLRDLINYSRPSSGRCKTADLTQFSLDDLSYVRDLGYVV